MATIQAEVKRGFFRCLFRTTATNPAPFIGILEAFQDNGFAAIRTGKLIVSTAGAGHSVAFKLPAAGDSFSQEEIFALSEEFITIHGDTVSTLAANGNASPDDTTIFNAMLLDDRLQGVREIIGDNTFARQSYAGTLG